MVKSYVAKPRDGIPEHLLSAKLGITLLNSLSVGKPTRFISTQLLKAFDVAEKVVTT